MQVCGTDGLVRSAGPACEAVNCEVGASEQAAALTLWRAFRNRGLQATIDDRTWRIQTASWIALSRSVIHARV
jgi:hypothetical protein